MPIIPISGSAVARGALVPLGRYVATAGNSGYILAFTNIPQNCQDLMIVGSSRNTANSMLGFPYLRLNDNDTAIYSETNLTGDGASTTSSRSSNATLGRVGVESSAYSAPFIFGSLVIHILNYANTTSFKTIISRSSADLNGSGQIRLLATLSRSTLGVSSIRISDEIGGQFAVGATWTLYGVRSVNQ